MPTIRTLTGRNAIDMGLRRAAITIQKTPMEAARESAEQPAAGSITVGRRIHKIDAIPTVRTQPKLRVAFYCRTSTVLEVQQSSIVGQRQHFEKLIASHDDWLLVDGYIEEGVTGTKAEVRPELQRLLRDCREGRIDKVLTKSISRFARNTTDCLEMVRELASLGVTIFFERENLDTGTMGSDLILTLLSAFAAQESQSISQNIKLGIHHCFQTGSYEQPTVPFGYRRTEDGVEIVEEQAAVVREIFSMALSGLGAANIAKILNERGVPTCEGKRWEAAQVLLILHNPFYAGDILYQKNYNDDEYKLRKNRGQLDQYYLPDHHVPIVSHDAFDNVEALIAQRRKECKTEERAAADVYPFRSRLFCAECGMPLNRVKGETGITYACGGFIRKAGCTKGTRVFEETVKNAFLTVLNKLSFSQKLAPCNRILDVYINSIREREREKNKKRLDEIDHELKMHSMEIERLAPTIRFKPGNRVKLNEMRTRVEALRREKLTLETQTGDTVKAERLRSFIHTAPLLSGTEVGAAFMEFVEGAKVKTGEYIEFTFTCGITLRQSISQSTQSPAEGITQLKKAKGKNEAANTRVA